MIVPLIFLVCYRVTLFFLVKQLKENREMLIPLKNEEKMPKSEENTFLVKILEQNKADMSRLDEKVDLVQKEVSDLRVIVKGISIRSSILAAFFGTLGSVLVATAAILFMILQNKGG